uniref:Uncharacterized protein n=1 Tax=Denticeps clupeoides TaxID=299321 RepID=A0AAY4DCT8_9TELE
MGLTAQGSDRPAENGVPRSDPNPREEGEGWGSDSHPDASSPGPPDPGVKRRKRRKKSGEFFTRLRRAARRYGLREAAEGDDWTLFWTDCSVSLDRVMDMKRYQPFIIDGFKFDLRLYVLVTSCDPFRIFMYNEGLARFCTSQYNEPTNSNEDVCMHLTNYAINKNSENFVRDDDTGSKR